MINTKALAIALTIGVMTATSGVAHATNVNTSAEFQTMLEKIHANQIIQRASIMNNIVISRATGTKSAAEFQAMIDNIHALQAKNRARVWKVVKEIRSAKKRLV